MGLTVAEIRDRAERFRAAVHEEIFEARSGRKPWPHLNRLYRSQSVLGFTDTLPPIERELAGAEGDAQRRLRRLLAWAAEHHVRSANSGIDDEYSTWLVTATASVGGREIPVRQLPALVETTADREERRALERARIRSIEEVTPLQLDRLDRWRSATQELGYGPYREAVQRLSGLNLSGLLREGRRFLAETEDLYREQLEDALRRNLGIPPSEAERHDAEFLRRMTWMDAACDEGAVLDRVRGDLREAGLPLDVGGRVELVVEPFPGPGMTPFCAPIRVPDRVVLFVMPTTTPRGCATLLREIGRALHWSWTDPELPFEYRALGDVSVAEAHGELFAGLALEPGWIADARQMQGAQLEEYLRLASLMDLYGLRRIVARLAVDIEMCESPRPGVLGDRWAELLQQATGFHVEPAAYLERLGQRFGVARELRARMLAAQLRRELRTRFDVDWYRNPRTGSWLGEWLAGGLSREAGELALTLGEDKLGVDALVAQMHERLDRA
jgi:hypothetical protein